MNIKVKICDKAIELIDLLANMPLADDEFVDEIIDGIRYNEPYRIEASREVRNSPFGLPCFFVNIDGRWRYISARYFSFV